MLAKILVVEAEAEVRKSCMACLSSIVDWTVLEAASGPEAIRLAIEEQPDIVLLDADLPSPDGLTLLATLHRHNITVVLLTAPGKGPNYHALGAVGVIEKPLDVVALARQVRDVLDREVEQTNPAIYSITRRR